MTADHDAWGQLLSPAPHQVDIGGVAVRVGHRVRLEPRRGGDVMDATLAGRTAVIETIDVTTDGEFHFSVSVEDDPGREFGVARYPAHRYFFRADEIVPLTASSPAESPASRPRILVAGIGNIFFGDDGFGVTVVRRLAERTVPPGVTIRDFGIRGLDLAYALQDGYDAVIFVDATTRGGEPGTLYVIEPRAATEDHATSVAVDAHGMDPVRVLNLARSMGRVPPRTVVLGCEPASIAPSDALDSAFVALSPPVAAAVDVALHRVESLIADLADNP